MYCERCKKHEPMQNDIICGVCHNETVMNDFTYQLPRSSSSNKTVKRKIDDCAECGRKMIMHGRGLCRLCYGRNRTKGTLAKYPQHVTRAYSQCAAIRRLVEEAIELKIRLSKYEQVV